MTAFWISSGLLTLLVLAVLCWPLLRRHGSAGASRKAINTAIYRDQFAELERDLTSGIQDVFPLPVLGVLNERPFGPCFNTRVDINKLEAAILAFMEDDEEETKHAEETKSKLS